jgi:hypothetical protein
MHLMKRVRGLFSRGSDEERIRRRIAKAQRQAVVKAERGRVEGSNYGGGTGG